MSMSNHSRLLTAVSVAARMTPVKKNPSPMKKLATPLPVRTSGSFSAPVVKPSPELKSRTNSLPPPATGAVARFAPHFRQNLSLSSLRVPQPGQDIWLTSTPESIYAYVGFQVSAAGLPLPNLLSHLLV